MPRFPALLLAILLGPWLSETRAGDEAQLSDGRRVPGNLNLDRNGQIHFTANDKMEPIAAEMVTVVRFPLATPIPFRVGGGLRMVLQDGQALTGLLLDLDQERAVLRTAWAEKVIVPRKTIIALTQLPGWQTVFEDNFAGNHKAWKTTGRPEIQSEPGKQAALLKKPGQELALVLSNPLKAGRVGVNFQERDGARGAGWLLELTFRQGQKALKVTVKLAGNDEGYPVGVPGLKGTMNGVPRSPGWHRVTVQFSNGSMRVLLDESALWYNLEQGPGGALEQVRLVCQDDGKGGIGKGAVALTEFCLARSVEEPVRPEGDPDQDEVWLATGDQVFGAILKADAHTITLETRGGRRSLPWTEVRGCYLRHSIQKTAQAGKRVRLWLRNGLTGDPDQIEGILLGLDDRRFQLRHAWLGTLNLERDWVRQMRPAGR